MVERIVFEIVEKGRLIRRYFPIFRLVRTGPHFVPIPIENAHGLRSGFSFGLYGRLPKPDVAEHFFSRKIRTAPNEGILERDRSSDGIFFRSGNGELRDHDRSVSERLPIQCTICGRVLAKMKALSDYSETDVGSTSQESEPAARKKP